MSDPSPIATKDVEIEADPEVSYQNWKSINSTERKINEASSDAFPPRTLIIKRKAKRKDDGPLEIVCGFIVEHQIGTMRTPRMCSRMLAN
jgi:acyl-CoA-dependent ceramide synthase